MLSCYSISSEAQNTKNPKYVITNLKGKVEIKKSSSSKWEPAENNQTVFGDYRLNVGRSLNLIKDNDIKPIYKMEDVSVDSAWENPHPHPQPKSYQPGGDIEKMGINDTVSIGFCFITTEGDWRIEGHIFITDSLDAIAINHTSPDTLYACGYWSFSNNYYPMSYYISNSVYVLLPNQDNIITFKEPIPVTREEESSIIFFCSKQEYNYSAFDGTPLEELKKNRSYIEFQIKCDNE